MPIHDTDHYFARWEHQYPGRFLGRDGADQLCVDPVVLLEHVPTLSGGEQVYAAVWFECYAGRAAPWLDEGTSALSLLGTLDDDLRADAVAHIARTWAPQLLPPGLRALD